MRVGNHLIYFEKPWPWVRRALTTEQVSGWYDEAVGELSGLERMFKDNYAFKQSIENVHGRNRPTIEARPPVKPGLFEFPRIRDLSKYLYRSRHDPESNTISIADTLTPVEGRVQTYIRAANHFLLEYARIASHDVLEDHLEPLWIDFHMAETGVSREFAEGAATVGVLENMRAVLVDKMIKKFPEEFAQSRLEEFNRNYPHVLYGELRTPIGYALGTLGSCIIMLTGAIAGFGYLAPVAAGASVFLAGVVFDRKFEERLVKSVRDWAAKAEYRFQEGLQF